MHHGTCVTNVPWCNSRSITRHSRRMRNPQFSISGKRPISVRPPYTTAIYGYIKKPHTAAVHSYTKSPHTASMHSHIKQLNTVTCSHAHPKHRSILQPCTGTLKSLHTAAMHSHASQANTHHSHARLYQITTNGTHAQQYQFTVHTLQPYTATSSHSILQSYTTTKSPHPAAMTQPHQVTYTVIPHYSHV